MTNAALEHYRYLESGLNGTPDERKYSVIALTEIDTILAKLDIRIERKLELVPERREGGAA